MIITQSSICGIHIMTLSKTYAILGSFGTLFAFGIAKLFSLLSFNIFVLLFLNFIAYIFALNGTLKDNPFQLKIAQIFLLPNIGAALYMINLAKKAMIFPFMRTWVYGIFTLATVFIIYTLFVIFVFYRTKNFLENELQRRRE